MNAGLTRANLDRLRETDLLTPIAQWVAGGTKGNLMCLDCKVRAEGRDKIGHCLGCPRAWREVGGEIEFWEGPKRS